LTASKIPSEFFKEQKMEADAFEEVGTKEISAMNIRTSHKNVRNGKFQVVIHTGQREFAGTNANVVLELYGEEGSSTGKIPLKISRENGTHVFQQNSVDTFDIEPDKMFRGLLIKISIGHDGSGIGPSWFLSSILILDLEDNQKYQFVYNRWINAHQYVDMDVSGKEQVHVMVMEARKLGPPSEQPRYWFSSEIKPYAKVTYGEQNADTEVSGPSTNPVWENGILHFKRDPKSKSINVKLFSKRPVNDAFLGEVTIPIEPDFEGVIDKWYEVENMPWEDSKEKNAKQAALNALSKRTPEITHKVKKTKKKQPKEKSPETPTKEVSISEVPTKIATESQPIKEKTDEPAAKGRKFTLFRSNKKQAEVQQELKQEKTNSARTSSDSIKGDEKKEPKKEKILKSMSKSNPEEKAPKKRASTTVPKRKILEDERFMKEPNPSDMRGVTINPGISQRWLQVSKFESLDRCLQNLGLTKQALSDCMSYVKKRVGSPMVHLRVHIGEKMSLLHDGKFIIPHNEYISNLQTGDCIAFSGLSGLASMIIGKLDAPFSHVGLVLRIKPSEFVQRKRPYGPNADPNAENIFLVECTGNALKQLDFFDDEVRKGVNVFPFFERIKTIDSRAIWHIPLIEPLLPDKKAQLIAYIKDLYIKKVQYDTKQMIQLGLQIYGLNKVVTQDLHSMFCSEMVSATLNEIGLTDVNPSSSTPLDVVNSGCYFTDLPKMLIYLADRQKKPSTDIPADEVEDDQ